MSTLKKTENNLGQDEKVRSLWKQSVIQFKHNRLAVVGLVIIVLFIVTILTTLAVDQITNYSFYKEYIIKQDLSLRLAKPSLAHPFGCDEFGRDLLLRILWGTKLSFAIGVVAIALSVIMGAPFGMIAAFYGGKPDNAIMRVMDVLLAVPYMLLAMAIVAALGTSTFNLLLALAVSGIAKYARIARAAVLTVKDSEFVEAARAVGASDGTILFQYILPDNAIMRVMDVLLAVPYMLLAMAIVAALGTSTFNLLLALAVSGIAKYARIARAAVLTVKDSEFVEAARAVGASDGTILFQYILPNALAPILVQVSLGIGDSILAVAGLSYLGLGVQPPQPEWGAILTTARTYMRDAWHISVFPGLFLILAVIAFNLFGDGLRDALDPKLKR